MQEAISNSEDYLHEHFGGPNFAKRVINQFESDYVPQMDSSAEMGPFFLNCYQTQIDVFRWMVELGGG